MGKHSKSIKVSYTTLSCLNVLFIRYLIVVFFSLHIFANIVTKLVFINKTVTYYYCLIVTKFCAVNPESEYIVGYIGTYMTR